MIKRLKYKKCTFCSEAIQKEAIKCKHCNEFLNKDNLEKDKDVFDIFHDTINDFYKKTGLNKEKAFGLIFIFNFTITIFIFSGFNLNYLPFFFDYNNIFKNLIYSGVIIVAIYIIILTIIALIFNLMKTYNYLVIFLNFLKLNILNKLSSNKIEKFTKISSKILIIIGIFFVIIGTIQTVELKPEIIIKTNSYNKEIKGRIIYNNSDGYFIELNSLNINGIKIEGNIIFIPNKNIEYFKILKR